MRLKHFHLTVILLPTSWEPAALSTSLASIAKLMQESELVVETLCVEMLPDGTDVHELRDRQIAELPKPLLDYLEFEDINYLVEYGSTARGLRRAVRCARGEYICLLREGDQIG